MNGREIFLYICVMSKIFEYPEAKQVAVCGDIHGDFRALVDKLCVQYGCTDTLLIVAGDCGFGFEKPAFYETEYNRVAGRLRKANNWVVFVRGNHDNPAYFREERIAFGRWRTVPDYSVVRAAGHDILCVGGAVSVDGVKRRVGTGMGHCQGSRCERANSRSNAMATIGLSISTKSKHTKVARMARSQRSPVVIVRMFPKRNDDKSARNPGVRNEKMMPMAMPNVQNTAIAESSRMSERRLNHCTPHADRTEKTAADNIGFTPRKTPSPMPPNDACVIPPLMNTSRRVTMYVPTSPHIMLASRLPRIAC